MVRLDFAAIFTLLSVMVKNQHGFDDGGLQITWIIGPCRLHRLESIVQEGQGESIIHLTEQGIVAHHDRFIDVTTNC